MATQVWSCLFCLPPQQAGLHQSCNQRGPLCGWDRCCFNLSYLCMLAIIHKSFQFIAMDRHQRHPNELFCFRLLQRWSCISGLGITSRQSWERPSQTPTWRTWHNHAFIGLDETCVRHREARSSWWPETENLSKMNLEWWLPWSSWLLHHIPLQKQKKRQLCPCVIRQVRLLDCQANVRLNELNLVREYHLNCKMHWIASCTRKGHMSSCIYKFERASTSN